MKRIIGGMMLSAFAALPWGGARAFAGDGSSTHAMLAPTPAPNLAPEAVAARVNGKPITMEELQKPLIEGYGLKVLLYKIQLTLALQKAEEQHVKVTPADYDAELQRTLKAAFVDAPKEDYPELLDQLLEKKGVSRPEFDMVMQVNAILRKIAEPEVAGIITDAMVREAFNGAYGETVVVKDIQCANPQEAARVLSRLAAGEKFEALVHTASRNARTASVDGELPKFSRQTENWSQAIGGGMPSKVPNGFKDWAFGPKVKAGDVSDPIQAGDGYHILKLVQRNAPKLIKYEDVKAQVRADLEQQIVEKGITQLRGQLAQMARQSMKIEDPLLLKQFEAKQAAQAKAQEAEKKARSEIEARTRAANQAARRDHQGSGISAQDLSGTPAGGEAGTSPANASAGERPPASKSAAPPAVDSKVPTPSK